MGRGGAAFESSGADRARSVLQHWSSVASSYLQFSPEVLQEDKRFFGPTFLDPTSTFLHLTTPRHDLTISAIRKKPRLRRWPPAEVRAMLLGFKSW